MCFSIIIIIEPDEEKNLLMKRDVQLVEIDKKYAGGIEIYKVSWMKINASNLVSCAHKVMMQCH